MIFFSAVNEYISYFSDNITLKEITLGLTMKELQGNSIYNIKSLEKLRITENIQNIKILCENIQNYDLVLLAYENEKNNTAFGEVNENMINCQCFNPSDTYVDAQKELAEYLLKL